MNPRDSQAIRDSGGSGWRRPQGETVGLERYFRILRERAGLIGLVVLVTTLTAAAYLAVATDKYRAESDLLVIPASRDQNALDGLPVIRESSDPTRDVETASRVVTSRNVAKSVIDKLGLSERPEDLLKQVTAEPVAQSNIVAIQATADSPDLIEALRRRLGEEGTSFTLLVPAVPHGLSWAADRRAGWTSGLRAAD